MPAQFATQPQLDLLFFTLRFSADSGTRVLQLCDRLCRQIGLRGRRIAADHVMLHGVGAYDGLPDVIVERTCEAGTTVSTAIF